MTDDIVKRLRDGAESLEDGKSNPVVWVGDDGAHAHASEVMRVAADEIVNLRTELAKRDAEIVSLAERDPEHMDLMVDMTRKEAVPIVEHVTPTLIDRVATAIHEGRMSAADKYGIEPGDDLEAIKRKIRRWP